MLGWKKQAGIKIAGRNINNLRHADDTTLMAESEEELKSLLMKVKEEKNLLQIAIIQMSLGYVGFPVKSPGKVFWEASVEFSALDSKCPGRPDAGTVC